MDTPKYAEQVIDGVLHYRTAPGFAWHELDPSELTARITDLTRERDELAQQRGELLQRALELEGALRSLIARYEHDGIPNDSLPVVEAARALIAPKGHA